MVSIEAIVPSYFNICLFLIGIAFWILLIYSTIKLVSNCYFHGFYKGIVLLLAPIYWITLFINAAMVSLIIFHEIDIHLSFVHHEDIDNIVRIFGSYVVLFLNFLIDCLTLSCWLLLFADLFDLTSIKLRNGLIHLLLILSIMFFIFVILSAISIEIVHITPLNINIPLILSYMHFMPIICNLIVFVLCYNKLPIAHPIDLSIGLYELNTRCSCCTRITQSIWSILIIASAQIIYLYILHIDIWSIEEHENDHFHVITWKNIGLLTYFIVQLIVLIFFWIFVSISIKQSFDFYAVLDTIKQVSDVNNKKRKSPLPVVIKQAQNNNKPIIVPLNAPAPAHLLPYQRIEHLNQVSNLIELEIRNEEEMVNNDSSMDNNFDSSNINSNLTSSDSKLLLETTRNNVNMKSCYREGESINDENAPSPPSPPRMQYINDENESTQNTNDSETVSSENKQQESYNDESSGTEQTEIRHGSYDTISNETDSYGTNPNIIVKF